MSQKENKLMSLLHKKFYAHSLPNEPDTSKWQPLEEHLRNVAEKAREFAEPFCHGEAGAKTDRLRRLGLERRLFTRYWGNKNIV